MHRFMFLRRPRRASPAALQPQGHHHRPHVHAEVHHLPECPVPRGGHDLVIHGGDLFRRPADRLPVPSDQTLGPHQLRQVVFVQEGQARLEAPPAERQQPGLTEVRESR